MGRSSSRANLWDTPVGRKDHILLIFRQWKLSEIPSFEDCVTFWLFVWPTLKSNVISVDLNSIVKGELTPQIDFSLSEHLGIVEQLYEVF